MIDGFGLAIEAPDALDLTKTRTSSLSMFMRAPFVIVAGGLCGEGTTMLSLWIGTRAERIRPEKLTICI